MKKYTAEFIGTYSLVFFAAGAGTVNEITHGALTHVGVAITCGLIVMVMIYALGNISGAHINPAVTIAFALNKSFASKDVLPYITSQVAGSFAAAFSLKLLFPASVYMGSTLASGYAWQSFVLEIILTFFLMFVILNVSHGSKEQGTMAGLAIGAVVLLEVMFAGPVSGASMNPARSVGPAMVSGNLRDLWVYLTAPFAGAISAVIIYRVIK